MYLFMYFIYIYMYVFFIADMYFTLFFANKSPKSTT